MPYISPERRIVLDENKNSPQNAGELNYVLTRQILQYIINKGECYQSYNDVIGVLGCIDNEIKFRSLNLYEVTKRLSNGDLDEFERLADSGS